jgi:hypothetical protein
LGAGTICAVFIWAESFVAELVAPNAKPAPAQTTVAIAAAPINFFNVPSSRSRAGALEQAQRLCIRPRVSIVSSEDDADPVNFAAISTLGSAAERLELRDQDVSGLKPDLDTVGLESRWGERVQPTKRRLDDRERSVDVGWNSSETLLERR